MCIFKIQKESDVKLEVTENTILEYLLNLDEFQ